MSEESDRYKLLFKIYSISKETGEDSLALEDVSLHNFDALHVAGVAYLIIDRYLSCVDESKQTEFFTEVIEWLDKMIENHEGSSCIDRIDRPDDL